ncbi:MAG: type II secretion system F family protein [Pseudomonadota bacterium]
MRASHKPFILRQIALVLRPGYRAVQALEISAELVEREGPAVAIRRMTQRIEAGRTFSQVVHTDPMFQPIVSALLHAGQQSCTLEKALDQIVDAMERSISPQKRIIYALI